VKDFISQHVETRSPEQLTRAVSPHSKTTVKKDQLQPSSQLTENKKPQSKMALSFADHNKRAVICDDCRHRTIDKASCNNDLDERASRIESAGFQVTKGSS